MTASVFERFKDLAEFGYQIELKFLPRSNALSLTIIKDGKEGTYLMDVDDLFNNSVVSKALHEISKTV